MATKDKLKENMLEKDMYNHLISDCGYTEGNMENYDRNKAIDLNLFTTFIKNTQINIYNLYKNKYGSNFDKEIYKDFQAAVDEKGLIYVLKNGFVGDNNNRIRAVYFKPSSNLNNNEINNYNQNILTATRQFKYCNGRDLAIDIVLLLNGIPIVSIELKNRFTNQDITHAIKQYREDRNKNEFCFHKDNRFLVYFAVDNFLVYMTTELNNEDTEFLPFNLGTNGAGKSGFGGNPVNNEDYAVSYLWNIVLKKDTLLNILDKFIQKQDDKIIFPRYHQFDVVNKIVEGVNINGCGKNFLIQHSTGSGKSNSIAWLAYILSELHNKTDKVYFDTIIIITDRTILDRQLQNTVSNFSHKDGLIMNIGDNKNSNDLKDAINNNYKIIITTIQKFPYIYQEINKTNKNYAVIIDEAHSSQNGENSKKLKIALSNIEETTTEDFNLYDDFEQKILEDINNNCKGKNISFFAFTATPRKVTLEAFGEKTEEGKYVPFHIYSMEQAIDEGFILNVLNNFIYYKVRFNIDNNSDDNPEVDVSVAKKQIHNFQRSDDIAIEKKSTIIVNTFMERTYKKIGAKAKGMLICDSRIQALKYYFKINEIINNNKLNIKVLVAFSGELLYNGKKYTEEFLNRRKDGSHIKESQLISEFRKDDDFKILIVADKYQTGFDEPLLHTMFVDKVLKGLNAVQTLSRLNRVMKNKKDTLIIDFVNTPEEIKKAFEPYFKETQLNKGSDTNILNKIIKVLNKYELYTDEDVNKFLKSLYTNEDSLSPIISNQFIDKVNKFNTFELNKKQLIKRLLSSYINNYNVFTSLHELKNLELEKLFIYYKYLNNMLILNNDKNTEDIKDKIKLTYYDVSKDSETAINIEDNNTELKNNSVLKVNVDNNKKEKLNDIIDEINELYKSDYNLEENKEVIDIIFKEILDSEILKNQVLSNNERMFTDTIFRETFNNIINNYAITDLSKYGIIIKDKKLYEAILRILAVETYNCLKSQ